MKGIAIGLLLFMLLVGVFAFRVQPADAERGQIIVPDEYPTIQEAINHATEGDTIFVKAGTYFEHVIVNKTVSLMGENSSTTVIDGNKTDMIVEIRRDAVNITGFTIRNAGADYHYPDDVGIFLDGVRHCNIYGNNVTNNRYGINVVLSSDNYIFGNRVANNSVFGLCLSSSPNNVLRNNTFIDNKYNFVVQSLVGYSAFVNDVDVSNTVNGKIIYYWLNQHNRTIPSNAGYVTLINCTNIVIQNLNLSNDGDGICLVQTTGSVITKNNITNNRFGVELWLSSNNSIVENNMANNSISVFLMTYSSYNMIVENSIINSEYYGFYALCSPDNVFRNNTLANNAYHFHVGGFDAPDFVNDIDTSNTVDGKIIYYWLDHHEETIPADAGYVALVNCTSIIVQNLNLTKNDPGILLVQTTNSTVTKNNITNNEDKGVSVVFSSNNFIAENNITNSRYAGVYLENSSDNVIIGNKIANIEYYGVELTSSSNNRIMRNHIMNNSAPFEAGIKIYSSLNNSIVENTLTNSYTGINLYYSSNNSIVENNIANNSGSITFLYSSNSRIFHNNFINNAHQVYALNSINTWDNGAEGNYWSNYAGVDTNHDGIGDTPYVIDANNQDNYPLMHPYISYIPGDINHDGIVDIKDASLIGVYWQKTVPPAPANVDINGDGLIDIKDASIIGVNWQKYI